MKNASSKKWTSRVMLLCGVMIFTLCIAGFLRHLAGELFVRQLGIDNAIVRATLVDVDNHLKTYRHKHQKDKTDNQSNAKKVNLEELYPFPAGESKKTDEQSEKFSLSKWNLQKKEYFSKKGDGLSRFIPFMNNFIELSKTYNLLLSWNLTVPQTYNAVIEMPDCKNYWVTIVPKNESQDIANAKSIIELNNFLRQKGIPFLYVQQPSKVSKKWDKNIDNIMDFKNENANILLSELSKEGVPFIDLRDEFDKLSRDEYHNLFFDTDHHWKPEASRWAAQLLFSELNQHYGFNVDTSLIDEDNFTKEIFEKSYLGSQGRKVTLAAASPDDISLYHTRKAYMLHFEIPDQGIYKDGDFEIMYDMKQAKGNLYTSGIYDVYKYADPALNRIVNPNAKDKHHVLVIHDSYTDPEGIFMALCVRQIDFIDPRDFNGSIHTFIEKEKPDMVIMQYYPKYEKKQFMLK